MVMARTTLLFGAAVSFFASACGQDHRSPLPPVDCSVEDAYEFANIANFTADQTGWYLYSDPTPGGAPNPVPLDGGGEDSNVVASDIPAPGRCGDTRIMKLEMHGKNFWGAGFADWAHNPEGSRVDGTEYEGIAFWARSPINFEKQFLFYVDDHRTLTLDASMGGEDLTGDGVIGPGDRVNGTECRLPPPEESGEVPCYKGGVDPPASAGVRVPEPDECGNQFHTRITTTESWQLFFIPWDDLVQWPCPNRLSGGIDKSQIARFEVKLTQGMQYEIWIDNLALYRSREN
jgi:hypothetical protein